MVAAGILSVFSIWLLEDASEKSSYSKDIEKWLLLSLVSTEFSLGSWGILIVFSYFGATDSQSMLTSASWLQKCVALAIVSMILRDLHQRTISSEDQQQKKDSSTLEVQILQGRNLVAKDKNIFGKWSTSDPYVKVVHGNHIVGRTKIISKTLNPVWKDEIFTVRISQEALEANKSVKFRIYDYDALSADDSMGEIVIPLLTTQNYSKTMWYRVSNGSDEHYCENASGELLVKVNFIM